MGKRVVEGFSTPMSKKLMNDSGMTLIEVVVAAGLLILLLMLMLQVQSLMNKDTTTQDLEFIRDNTLSYIASSVRADMSQLSMWNLPATQIAGPFNAPPTLAFSEHYFGPVGGCANCPYELGYDLHPLKGVPGIYILRVDLYYPPFGPANVYQPPYDFIIGDK
jgi:hypothetical protein